jgi:two-component sensor histidine kinase
MVIMPVPDVTPYIFAVTRSRGRVSRAMAERTTITLLLAAAVAFGMSLQYLAQPFVWRNWPLDEVMEGWLYILRDRLVVAVAIALTTLLLSAPTSQNVRVRTALLAASVLIGAAAGEWVVRLLYDSHDSVASWFTHVLRWSVVGLAAAGTYYLWRSSVDSSELLRREDLRRQTVEQQLTNTRLTALRKQIEPHFLFNTLATVRRLHQTEPETGAIMLVNFIDYLARLLPMLEHSEVPLGDEADLITAYLSMIQIRMSERLNVRINVPFALRRARVPPLALATLVENAVKHGIAPLPQGGSIEVIAVEKDGMLELSVSDNGVGFKSDTGGGAGIGLYNVRTRLATLHGVRGTLQVQANPVAGVRASIRLPLGLETS